MRTQEPFPLGPILATIDEDSPILAPLRSRTFRTDLPQHGDPQPRLTIHAAGPTRAEAIDSHVVRRFPYVFTTSRHRDGLRFAMRTSRGRAIYTIDVQGHPLTGTTWDAVASIHPPWFGPMVPGPAVLALTQEHPSIDAAMHTILTDEVIEPLIWLALVEAGASLVHAGAVVSPAGQGVLLLGSGHVGKTTLVLELVINHEWRYLGEDLVIVDGTTLRRLPRPVRLARHHADLISGLPRHARVRGRRNPRRRLEPHHLFGASAVADSAPLDHAVHLIGHDSSTTPQSRVTDPHRLSSRAAATICDEYWEFLRFFNSAAALDPGATSTANLFEQIAANLTASMAGVPCSQLLIPAGTSADVTANELLRGLSIE